MLVFQGIELYPAGTMVVYLPAVADPVLYGIIYPLFDVVRIASGKTLYISLYAVLRRFSGVVLCFPICLLYGVIWPLYGVVAYAVIVLSYSGVFALYGVIWPL